MFVDSAKLGVIRLEFADSTYKCRFHDSLSLLNTYIIVCLWIPQTVPDSVNFVADSTIFVADSAKLLVFGAILSNSVLAIFRGIQNSKDQRKKGNFADSATILFLACC